MAPIEDVARELERELGRARPAEPFPLAPESRPAASGLVAAAEPLKKAGTRATPESGAIRKPRKRGKKGPKKRAKQTKTRKTRAGKARKATKAGKKARAGASRRRPTGRRKSARKTARKSARKSARGTRARRSPARRKTGKSRARRG
jgi:hypothetical protein